MSGAKRKTKYRKGVENEILGDLPEPQSENEFVVRVLGLRGGNLVEVETADGHRLGQVELCRLPSRFKNVIWVKRGSFLIAERAGGESESEEGKVRFVCLHVLFSQESVKHLKQRGLFPEAFCADSAPVAPSSHPSSSVALNDNNQDDNESVSDEEEDYSMQNPNRRQYNQPSESESESE